MPAGTSQPCSACARHRKHHQQWLAQQTLENKKAEQQKRRDEAATRQTAIDNCDLCDDDGYRPNHTVCDHIDRTFTARRGRDEINKAMGWTK
jgi:hypothetical protein